MNKVILCGRLTKAPEVRYSAGDASTMIARYSLAIDRKYKREGEPSADFVNCIAFGKSAEFAEKWLNKGIKILIVGRIQTGSYTNKDGIKVYTTDIIVDEHEFVEHKAEANSSPAEGTGLGFMSIPAGIDEELPFGN